MCGRFTFQRRSCGIMCDVMQVIYTIIDVWTRFTFQRRSRGIVCDVWVGVFYDVDAARNMTAEWYFTPVGIYVLFLNK